MDAESLAAREEVLGRPHGLGNGEDVRVLAVEGDFRPGEVVDDGPGDVPGVREFPDEPLDGRVDVCGDVTHHVRNVHRNVVSLRDRAGVALVPVEQDDDAGDRAKLREQVVDPRGVDGVDHPHVAVDRERVAGPLHRLVRVGEPADTTSDFVVGFEPVDLRQIGRRSGAFHRHGRTYATPGEKTTTQTTRATREPLTGAAERPVMLSGPRWLALEVKYLDRARSFYEAFLDLEVRRETETEAALGVGGTDLILRRPSTVPRGGLHTHYAMEIPAEEYDDWYDRLAERFDLVEHQFGTARSLYFYDTEGNCVELGERTDTDARGVSGLFEVVFEVEDLPRALEFYETLGFETVDEGDDRTRVRLSCGAFDIELWEPHLGLADARGGVHVDIGIGTDDPTGIGEAVADDALAVDWVEDGVRVRDPEGHSLTLLG